MSHLSLAATLPEASPYGGKTLLERTTGRFYTPNLMAVDLANRIVQSLVPVAADKNLELTICDPFCGDGRLVAEVLFAAAKRKALRGYRWKVKLFDVDPDSTEQAASYITDVATALRITITLEVTTGDTFLTDIDGADCDVIVTNPPWEHIKPDARELREMSDRQQLEYKGLLRLRSQLLDQRFSYAASPGQWAGWGTNLARCGWELSLRMCKKGGVVGIVLPTTLLADQASANLRKYALSESTLLSIASYPAEARLFDRVDQAVTTIVSMRSTPNDGNQNASLRTFHSDLSVAADVRLRRNSEQLEMDAYALPVGFGAAASHLSEKLAHLSALNALESHRTGALWTGREVDETRMSEKVTAGTRHPFIKGKMIERHGIKVQPDVSVRPEFVPTRSVTHERIVWRDVSRTSQARRMIATIIPANWVAGNSLHVAFFRDGDPLRLRALYAVISSYVLEFQVRTRLATGHVSLGVVRSARIPDLTIDRTVKTLAEAATAALRGNGTDLLEVTVAKAYGLQREDYAEMLNCFPKISPAERDGLLSKDIWTTAYQ